MKKVTSNNTAIFTENGKTACVLHSTKIVEWDADSIILNTNGWFTVTTKKRMNEVSAAHDLGFHVWQKKGAWYVDHGGKTHEFSANSITLNR